MQVVIPFPLDFMSFSIAPDTDRLAVAGSVVSTATRREKALPSMELVLASSLGDIG